VLTLVVVLVGGAVLGVVRGGSLESLAATSFRWSWLIFAGLFLQLGTDLVNPPWLGRPGMLVVIGANGAMPVSPGAAEMAGLPPPRRNAELKHEPVSEDTLLPWLGDQFPVPRAKSVLSLGDLVLYLGLARLVYVRTHPERRKPPPPRA